MRKIFFISLLFLIFCTLNSVGQEIDKLLRIKAKVIKISNSSFDQEKEPPEFSFIILTYKVLKICKGAYEGDEIKVAHGVLSRRKLKVGDEVFLEANPTKEFREAEEILQQLDKTRSERSEEFIADYIFVGFRRSNSCL